MALRLLYLIIRDIRVVLTAPQPPRMNAIMEQWVGSVRRELLDRILIMDERQLRKVLAEYEAHFNAHRVGLDYSAPVLSWRF
jgi:Integrase core domain